LFGGGETFLGNPDDKTAKKGVGRSKSPVAKKGAGERGNRKNPREKGVSGGLD